MNSTAARTVGKAVADIRGAIKGASAEDRAAVAQSLRDLLASVEGTAAVRGVKPARTATPTAAEITKAARAVLAAGGGFGDSKAFISEVYETLGLAMSLPDFKALLVGMQCRGDLNMSRADLVEVMDPVKVATSETRDLGASWHFIRID
jgi:hypothetical protein